MTESLQPRWALGCIGGNTRGNVKDTVEVRCQKDQKGDTKKVESLGSEPR